MKAVVKYTCRALLLCLVTTGLSLWGMWLDPWLGEMRTGEHPLIFLGVPLWACVIGLPQFGVPFWLGCLAGAMAQFIFCLLIVGVLRLLFGFVRLLGRIAGRILLQRPSRGPGP